MLILIIAFLVSLLPAFVLYFWLKKQQGMPEGYPDRCRQALFPGARPGAQAPRSLYVCCTSSNPFRVSQKNYKFIIFFKTT